MARKITRPIPITPFGRAADNPSDAVWCEDAKDGYFHKYDSPDGPKLIWVKRPGITYIGDSGRSGTCDGLYYWDRQDVALSINNGYLDSYSFNGGSYSDDAGTANVLMTPGHFVSIADVAGTDLYMSSGGKIVKYTPSVSASELTDGDAPTSVKSVGVLDTILLGLRADSERFDWADAGTPTDWAGEYSNAQSKPDLNKNAVVLRNYYHIFGSQTYEPWRFDGSTFVRENGAVLGIGTGAADSLCIIGDDIYFVNNRREICRLRGFQIEILSSSAITRYIQSFNPIDDAHGQYLPFDGKHFYIVSFYNENKTIVYDIELNTFYEWGCWDSVRGEYDMWRGRCIAVVDPWNKVLCGDTKTRYIFEIGGETDYGDTIRTVLRTGEIDHGYPDINKFSSSLTAVFKRSGTAATPKNITIRWRDNGRTAWEEPMTMQCEEHGTTSYVAQIRRLGHYKTRVWEIVMSDDSQASLVSLAETFSVGR